MNIDKDSDAAAELREADLLLSKADALLKRHRFSPAPPDPIEDDFSDIPILTDVVEDFELEPLPEPLPEPPPPKPIAAPDPVLTIESDAMIEQLVGLDTEIARAIEDWFENELPQLVSREFDRFSAHLHEQAIAQVRATLLPILSERVATRLTKSTPKV